MRLILNGILFWKNERQKIAGIAKYTVKAMNPIRYIQNVLTNRQYFWHFFWMMLIGECVLGCLFIQFVPCFALLAIVSRDRHGDRLESVHGRSEGRDHEISGLHTVARRNGYSLSVESIVN